MRLFWRLIKIIKRNPYLTSILVLGLLLRFIGVYPGYYAHGDEIMYGEAVKMVKNFTLTLEPQFLGYPPLIAWLLAIFYILFIPIQFLLFLLSLPFSDHHFDQIFDEHFFRDYIFGRNWENPLYWSRYTTALFGVGTIFLTYILAIKLFSNRLISLVSAFLVSVNYRLVLNSHIGFIDTYNSFFNLFALITIINVWEKPSLKNYIYSWLAVTAAFLAKYQFYTLIVLLICQILLSLKQSRGNMIKAIRFFLNRHFITGGLIAGILVVSSHIQYFQHLQTVLDIHEYEALKYAIGVQKLNLFPISYLYNIGIGPLLSVLFLFGIMMGFVNNLFREKVLFLLIVLFIMGYIYFYYTHGGFYTRNLLAAIPIILIFSAYSFTLILNFFRLKFKFFKNRINFLLVAVIFLFFASKDHLINSIEVVKILSQPSDRVTAEEWLNQNLSPGVKFANFPTNPSPSRLSFEHFQLPNPSEAFSYREMLEYGYDYYILDFYNANLSIVWWMNLPLDIAMVFWEKQDDLLAQGFSALAIRELLWSHSAQVYLPDWQVYGYNYAVVNLQENTELPEMDLKLSFNFMTEDWFKLSYFEDYKRFMKHSNNIGRSKAGSLVLGSPANEIYSAFEEAKYIVPGGYRWESDFFNAKGSYSYKVIGYIKNGEFLEKSSRNGFLRLDFYKDKKNNKLTSRPIISYISERIYGESNWHRVEIYGVAPENAKYFTLSFQAEKHLSDLYLDDVEIWESREQVLDDGAMHFTIPDEDLFPPNDQGFL